MRFLLSTRGGIDVGLLGENHHKSWFIACEGSSIKLRCCPPFVDHVIGHNLWIFFKVFLHPSNTTIMNDQSGGVLLYLMPQMIDHY